MNDEKDSKMRFYNLYRVDSKGINAPLENRKFNLNDGDVIMYLNEWIGTILQDQKDFNFKITVFDNYNLNDNYDLIVQKMISDYYHKTIKFEK